MFYTSLIIGGIITLYLLHLFYVNKNKNIELSHKKVLLRIKANKLNDRTAKAAEQIFAPIHGVLKKENIIDRFLGKKSPIFSFEIALSEEKIFFYVYCNDEYKNLILSQLHSQYQDIEIEETEEIFNVGSYKDYNFIGADLETTNPYIYPIKRHTQFEDKITQNFLDPVGVLTESISNAGINDKIFLQFTVRPINNKWREIGNWAAKKIAGGFIIDSSRYKKWYTNLLLKKISIFGLIYSSLMRFILAIIGLGPKQDEGKGLGSEVQEVYQKETEEQGILSKLSQLGFEINIRIIYLSKDKRLNLENKINLLIAPFQQFNIPRFNSIGIRKISKSKILLRRYQNREIHNGFILNTEELATLWHLPYNNVSSPKIQWTLTKKVEAPSHLPIIIGEDPEITALGNTNFRGVSKLFGIKTQDRRRHMYIIGKTGMGKTTIIENMIASDINNNKGVAVIDPHGDLADNILGLIPKRRTNDILLFDPSDTEFPISFNMLECQSMAQRHLVASGLVGVFKKMFGTSWGPRLEHILRNTCLTLTEIPGSTMLGILKILTDVNYRKSVVAKLKDPILLNFWIDEFGRWDQKTIAENVSPIQNKVGQFLSFPIIRNILGQPKSSIDLRFAMDSGKIVIINLSKGKIGEDVSSLLGSMIITKFQLDAMSRANIKESERKDFYLYVDEFQNFATDSFATILAEARKYKLNLTMANQYINQMSEEVKYAIFGNIGSLVTFQVGPEDADTFSKQYGEKVLPADIVGLPKYNCYMNLLIDGIPSGVFSAATLEPPKTNFNLSIKESILKNSRERYAKKREFVEEKIKSWLENPK